MIFQNTTLKMVNGRLKAVFFFRKEVSETQKKEKFLMDRHQLRSDNVFLFLGRNTFCKKHFLSSEPQK